MRKPSHDWSLVLEQFEGSGLSQQKFCRDNGISLSSLTYWLKKKRNGRAPSGSKFIELDLTHAPEPERGPASQAELVVELPLGVVLRFHGASR